jgi:hypothetical protein
MMSRVDDDAGHAATSRTPSPMNPRVRGRLGTWLAFGLWAVGTVLMVAALVLLRLGGTTPDGTDRTDLAYQAVLLATYLALSVGTWVAARRPTNPTGWLLCGPPFGGLGAQVVALYTSASLAAEPRALPAVSWAAWVGDWIWCPIVVSGPWLLLLFPNGQLPSRRWRPFAWVLAVLSALLLVTAALRPGPTEMAPRIVNPLGVELVSDLADVVAAVMLGALLGSGAALLLRFRRSRGEERQQIKVVVYAGTVLAVLAVIGQVVFWYLLRSGDVGALIFWLGMPVAVAVAILKNRLYDIDRIINRTLVYGLLTALLAGLYASVVLVLGWLFGGIGAEPPSWAVAGATLAVAALFQPARRRLQHLVDRRFNRRRYNSAQTIEAFSTRLHQQIDLNTLSAELLAVVDQTMQPTKASLWLRPSVSSSPSQDRAS